MSENFKGDKSPKTSLESLDKFLKNIYKYEDEEIYGSPNIFTSQAGIPGKYYYKMHGSDVDTSSVRDVWEFANKPYIVEWKPSDLYQHHEEVTGRPANAVWFDTDERITENPVDTLNIKRGNLVDFMAELSHAVQYNRSQDDRDSISANALNQLNHMMHEQRYGEDWTHEGTAHLKIEPKLWNMLKQKSLMTKLKEWWNN
ncbi:MAG: hypothetical protein Unbinned3849contig1000_38 [Prokaryotic dsDNA virus sp.]|nr:MAG: hypothetical protein Unbinned3849contig1000_38 [Prokaryotic dsDNA virus sp.]|tara:strand:+ start:25765 stop:26364 length:600 start_codon:yes stop_codon:yes gene_type:complete